MAHRVKGCPWLPGPRFKLSGLDFCSRATLADLLSLQWRQMPTSAPEPGPILCPAHHHTAPRLQQSLLEMKQG